jgi:hypothetical protein
MKVDPTGRVPGQLAKPATPKAEQPPSTPSDKLEISGKAPAGATYDRAAVTDRPPLGSRSEVEMAAEARAQKLAEIRSRMDAGVYNSRDMIEKVVDRLLSAWKLGPSRNSDSNA